MSNEEAGCLALSQKQFEYIAYFFLDMEGRIILSEKDKESRIANVAAQLVPVLLFYLLLYRAGVRLDF